MRLDTPHACAGIWLHRTDTSAYRLTVCADRVSVETERDADTHTRAYVEITPPLPAGRWHRIDVEVHAATLAAMLDGAPALTKPGLSTDTSRAR